MLIYFTRCQFAPEGKAIVSKRYSQSVLERKRRKIVFRKLSVPNFAITQFAKWAQNELRLARTTLRFDHLSKTNEIPFLNSTSPETNYAPVASNPIPPKALGARESKKKHTTENRIRERMAQTGKKSVRKIIGSSGRKSIRF